jgi:hypothetical protein
MNLPTTERIAGTLLPDTKLSWFEDRNLVDFSVPYTFELEVEPFAGGELSFPLKTSGFTGAATEPNVTIAWDTDEIDVLEPGSYRCEITATRDSDDKPRKRQWRLEIVAEVS